VRFFQYSILSIQDSTPQVLAAAKMYYSSIDLAFQLCKEFAAAERGNAELLEPLERASKLLERIVAHNALLKSSDFQPAWPKHEALLRFDLLVQRLTTHFRLGKKWFPRYMSLRGSRLYYSDGKNGHPDTAAGTLAFMRLKPAPDGRYCVNLQGMRAASSFNLSVCNAAVQAAALRRAARQSTGWRLPSRSSSLLTAKLIKTCTSLLPTTPRASAACASSKLRAQAVSPPPCPTSHCPWP
jgi:hypothetical protein